MSATLSIIATLYNKDEASLTAFLDGYVRQTRKDFELILIDDCSDVEYGHLIEAYQAKLPLTYVRFGSNKGQCHARNVGILQSTAPIVAIVDSDCIPNAKFVEAHIQAQQTLQLDVVIGPYNIETNNRDVWALMAAYEADAGSVARDMALQDPEHRTSFLNFITRNVSIKKSAFRGPLFDTAFSYLGDNPSSGFGWEDVEAGYRLFKAGVRFGFVTDAFTLHYSHPSTTDPTIKPLRSLRNFERLLFKHPTMLNHAAPWIVETYGRIYQWFLNTRGGIERKVFNDNAPPWMSVVLTLTRENEHTHPMVIESILARQVPGMLVHLVTKKGYKSPTAEYYSKLHNFVRVLEVDDPASTPKGTEHALTLVMRDDLPLPAVPSTRPSSGQFDMRQVLTEKPAPMLGGFQDTAQFYARDLAPRLKGIAPRSPSKRLKVLTYRWHCGHQYELYKLPHDFYLATDPTTMDWDYNSRPLPSNASFVEFNKIDHRDYDVAILHFDECAINPAISNGTLHSEWGAIFRRFLNEVTDIPRVAVCHGTPPFHGMFNLGYSQSNLMEEWVSETERIKSAVGSLPVVCNSWNAWKQWGFPNSRVIWHGFDANEYPLGGRHPGVLYAANSIRHRPWYRGYYWFKYIADQVPCHYLGRDDKREFTTVKVPEPSVRLADAPEEYARQKFKNYQGVVGNYSVFLNTTLRSPMPRTRTEAMLAGSVAVTTDFHDESLFIETGVNGFCGSSKEELTEHVRWLLAHPGEAEIIGLRGRETAKRLFAIDRYLQDWQATLVDVMGGRS